MVHVHGSKSPPLPGDAGLIAGEVRFTAAAAREWERAGLIGWVQVDLRGGVTIDSVAVIKLDGCIVLRYPSRTDRRGRRHRLVLFRDQDVRASLDAEILAKLRAAGNLEGNA